MKPSVVLLGFVLGSAAAITFGLGGVAIVFALLLTDEPRFAAELPGLLNSLAMFAGLTAVAAASFYGQLREARWRFVAIAFLLTGLALAVWHYWPP